MFLFFATTLDNQRGGIARTVPRLAQALGAIGESVILVGPHSAQMTIDLDSMSGVDVRLGDNPGALKQLLRQSIQSLPSRNAIVYHAGIWSPWNHRCASYARAAGKPYISSTHNSLHPEALRRSRLKKKLAWWCYAAKNLNTSLAIHTTSEAEAETVRQREPHAPVFVVPHGVDIPFCELRSSRAGKTAKRLLYLARLHRGKGLEDLIHAFTAIDHPDWELVIAGNGDPKYCKQLQQRAASGPNPEHIKFIGTVSDQEKWQTYTNADAFVLPSYYENFGLVIAEALASKLPVITTTGTPWNELPTRKCGWYIPTGAASLQATLNEVFATDSQTLQTMGQNGHDWMRTNFTWQSRAKAFAEQAYTRL